jgi:hypothetical protein
MIETCNFCQKEHDVGDGSSLGGVVIKTCPEMPENMLFNPADFRRFTHDKESLEMRLVSIEDDKARIEMLWKYQLRENMNIFR